MWREELKQQIKSEKITNIHQAVLWFQGKFFRKPNLAELRQIRKLLSSSSN